MQKNVKNNILNECEQEYLTLSSDANHNDLHD